MELNVSQLKKHKTSNTIYILGSGPSILNVSKEEWKHIQTHDSIGFNHWYVHGYEPTFYDLSYLADNDFKDKDTSMYYQASIKCKNSKFILNKQITPSNFEYFKNSNYLKIYVNHFDFFDKDISFIEKENPLNIGTQAFYWTEEFFKVFNNPKGELLPNENYIYKSRSQLFATIQICVLLGYNDIRLIGIDLNSESKFQDNIPDAPYSSKSPHSLDKTLESRNHHMHNAKEVGGVHNTAQGTKDKDYLGIHKLLRIFNEKCLKRIGSSLTVCNQNSLLITENIKYQSIIGNLPMEKITFCIPSKSNVRYLKTCIPSIRNNAYRDDHEIIIFVDSDEDDTVEWLKQVKDEYNLSYYVNPKLGEELYGIGRAYDFCIEKSTTDIFMIFHADMILGKNADFEVYKHLKEKTVVCATRIEPPLHPNNGEKVLKDFGMYPEEFKKEEFLEYVEKDIWRTIRDKGRPAHKPSEGIFAPWMMYKKEYLEILGGHDPILHSCREDSDVFNRMLLSEFEFIQTWEGFVYHFTGRGAGSFDGDEERHKFWQQQMNNSTKDFIRKWGQNVNHTPMMKPIVYPKYEVGIVVENCIPQLLEALEPWCSYIYVDLEEFVLYSIKEQEKSSFNIDKRVKGFDPNKHVIKDNITVKIDGDKFTQQDMQIIQQLPAIIQDSGEIGEFELGNLKIQINDLTTYENELVKYEK